MPDLRPAILLFIIAAAGWTAGAVAASSVPERGSSRDCLSLNRIERSEILDNQHIAFKMIDGKYYINVLPVACPSLHRNSALMYQTSLSRLCDLDIITVLDSLGGGYEPRGSCGLGEFNESTQDEVKELRDTLKNPAGK